MMSDSVNHPKHYTSHPSGIEAIEVTQHYNFCVGNAIKYCWRAGLKESASKDPKEKQIEDLKKAVWYINREIKNLKEGVYDGENKQEQNESMAQVRGWTQLPLQFQFDRKDPITFGTGDVLQSRFSYITNNTESGGTVYVWNGTGTNFYHTISDSELKENLIHSRF